MKKIKIKSNIFEKLKLNARTGYYEMVEKIAPVMYDEDDKILELDFKESSKERKFKIHNVLYKKFQKTDGYYEAGNFLNAGLNELSDNSYVLYSLFLAEGHVQLNEQGEIIKEG